MKKLLTVFLVLLFAISGFSDVAVRIVPTTFISNPLGTDHLTVEIQANATFAYPVDKFQGAVNIGANLNTLLTGSTFTAAASHYFPNTNYTQTYGVSAEGSIYFYYQYTGPAGPVPPATRVVMPVGTWQKIFDVTLDYTNDNTKQTTFYWTTDPYYYSVELMAYIDIGGGDPVNVPIPVTGGRIDIPSSLVDRTLPVQMSSFTGSFNYDKGITVRWMTRSETHCKGFYLWKGLSANGQFTKITTSLIQALGNSPTGQEYAVNDKDVKLGSRYFYKVQEVSDDYEMPVYYGTIEVATPNPPSQFALGQNYPNPFNPSTTIVFEVPERSNVLLKLYNLLGKEVRTLVNEEKQPGVYPVTWDGMDEAGRMLPSGLYFYKISAGDRVEIRKMMKVQ